MGAKRATIADVAARAGVDPGLVSKVLNNKPGLSIRDSTRERVHRAATELSYRPSNAARSLRTARTGALGVLLPTFTNPIWTIILDAAEAEADRRGYTLVAGIAGDASSGQDRRPSRFLEWVRSGTVDGLLVASTLSDEDLGNGFGQTPWLHINRRPDTSRRHVLLDDAAGMHLATEHLLDLGHRRLAHVSGPLDTDSGRRRLAGFEAATTAAGLGTLPVAEARYDTESGHRAMQALLTHEDEVTGVVCANVASAAGVLAAAVENGLRVPEDLSVIALHDIGLARSFQPALTTVLMPLDELGRRAVSLILDRPADDEIDEMITGPIRLVERASTAPPPMTQHA